MRLGRGDRVGWGEILKCWGGVALGAVGRSAAG